MVVVCKASHLSKEENKPVILRDADNNQIGIQRNAYWEIALLPNTDFIIDGDNIHDGIITEAKLDDALQDKVNDNVKTVPQDLNEAQVKQAQKNIYFRDDYNNVYLDPSSYKGNTFGSDCANNYFSALCTENVFGKSCYNNTFGVYCVKNNFGDEFYENQLGNDCHSNVFGKGCCNNRFGNYCNNNIFNDGFSNNILDNNVRYITITDKHVKNIHILGNVQGSDYQRLKITIPAEYRDPDRRLIITRET